MIFLQMCCTSLVGEMQSLAGNAIALKQMAPSHTLTKNFEEVTSAEALTKAAPHALFKLPGLSARMVRGMPCASFLQRTTLGKVSHCV